MKTRMAVGSWIFFVAVATFMSVVSTDPCTWPKYFDLSSRAADKRQHAFGIIPKADMQISWRTELKLNRKKASINKPPQTQKLIEVLNSSVIEMFTTTRINDYKREATMYECHKDISENTFLLKRLRVTEYDTYPVKKNHTQLYRCLSLQKQSKFVVQWSLGPESQDTTDCASYSGKLSEWPLVYWPITGGISFKTVPPNTDLLDEYPKCPFSAGYMVKLFNSSGEELRSCSSFPSFRFEMECVEGEGLYLVDNQFCSEFSSDKYFGSTLNCLGSWTDEKYRYTEVVPERDLSINMVHCLRTNKDDPTKEQAILFLDNVCKSTEPDIEKDSFLRLEFRQKQIDTICDDYSDQCEASQVNCSDPTQSAVCFTSCRNCPTSGVVQTKQGHRGEWLLQTNEGKKKFRIEADIISIPSLGQFWVRAENKEECNTVTFWYLDGKDKSVFALARLADGIGCLPRIMSFAMERVNDGIAFIWHSPTAPLINNKHALNVTKWCTYFKYSWISLFNSYWPRKFPTFGNKITWYTVVNSKNQKTSNCSIDSLIFDVSFNLTLNKNNKISLCKAQISPGANEMSWNLNFDQCNDGVKPGSYSFSCLGHQRILYSYYMTVAQASNTASDSSQAMIQPGGYYCLMFPTKSHIASRWDPYPLFINPAGQCSPSLVETADDDWKGQKPLGILRYNTAPLSTISLPVILMASLVCMFQL